LFSIAVAAIKAPATPIKCDSPYFFTRAKALAPIAEVILQKKYAIIVLETSTYFFLFFFRHRWSLSSTAFHYLIIPPYTKKGIKIHQTVYCAPPGCFSTFVIVFFK
jgi:hypothetical protein